MSTEANDLSRQDIQIPLYVLILQYVSNLCLYSSKLLARSVIIPVPYTTDSSATSVKLRSAKLSGNERAANTGSSKETLRPNKEAIEIKSLLTDIADQVIKFVHNSE